MKGHGETWNSRKSINVEVILKTFSAKASQSVVDLIFGCAAASGEKSKVASSQVKGLYFLLFFPFRSHFIPISFSAFSLTRFGQ